MYDAPVAGPLRVLIENASDQKLKVFEEKEKLTILYSVNKSACHRVLSPYIEEGSPFLRLR